MIHHLPLCLLNALATLLEYIILGRLEQEMNQGKELFKRQFILKKGQFTLAALEEIFMTTETVRKGWN